MENQKEIYRRAGTPAPRPGALAALFLGAVLAFSLLNLFWPKREVSELENRRLASLPAFNVKALLDGSWQAGFANWMQDQVALRDGWLWLESAVSDIALLRTEEGGILLGHDGWMFTEQFTVSDAAAKQLERNTAAMENLAGRWGGKATFLLAPSAAVIYPEALPAGAPMIDENALLDGIFARVQAAGANVLDLRGVYSAGKDEYLYYKTDHHWTTRGAYLAYREFCILRGLTPYAWDDAAAVAVPDFYGTHYSATRRWNVQTDTLTYFPLEAPLTVYRIEGEAQFTPTETRGLLSADKLAVRDKYAAFLGGNDGYAVVEGRGKGSILVVKDSYANCFIPFLTENYAKIGIVDFRGFSYGLDSTIQAEGYDEVLVLYNFQTFMTDTHAINLARPSTVTAAPESGALPEGTGAPVDGPNEAPGHDEDAAGLETPPETTEQD